MKIGICYSIKRALTEDLSQAEHLEISCNPLKKLEETERKEFYRAVKEGRLCVKYANGMLPGDMQLTGPDADPIAAREYCAALFEQLAELGIQTVVFGSGKARSIPEGFSISRAWEQLFALGSTMADLAAPYGQTVVVEPLSVTETNVINTLDEGAYYVNTVNRKNFRLMVDFYHFDYNRDNPASLMLHKDLIHHAHFASAKVRAMPQSEEEWAFFTQCVTQLHQIGYDGPLSFEGVINDRARLNDDLLRMKQIRTQITG